MMKRYLRRVKTLLAAGMALGLVTACRDAHNAGHAHDPAPAESDHDHEHQTHQITVWSDRFEIFAEFEPVAAGRAFDYVAHVTALDSGSPRVDASLRLTLRRGNKVVEHVEERPAYPGIYVAELTLNEPGLWDLAIDLPGPEGGSSVTMPAIAVHADVHEAAHAEVPEAPEDVLFLKEQQWRIRMGTERVAHRRLVERLMFPARVVARPGGTALVVAPMAGQVREPAGRAFPQLGDRVEAGEVLAMLEPRFSDAAARLVEVEAERIQAGTALDQARAVFDRVERLAAAQAKSERELQEAAAGLAMARTRLDAVTALQSSYRQPSAASGAQTAAMPAMELRAPITGIVNRISVGAGEVVGPDAIVCQVIDAAVVWIEARIPEGGMGRLRPAEETLYERPDRLGEYTAIENPDGIFLGIEVDAETRTVPLTVEVRNPEGTLRVGQSVRLHVATARVERALAVPEAAIVEEGGRPVAFVQVSGERFEKRDLVLGVRDGPWVEVLEGVGENERVVTEGAYVVRLASVSSIIPTHGHAH